MRALEVRRCGVLGSYILFITRGTQPGREGQLRRSESIWGRGRLAQPAEESGLCPTGNV